jgi:copper(I)-binding protein
MISLEKSAMNRNRITRRQLAVLGTAFPFAGLLARVATAHDGPHGAATPEASPEANTGTGAVYLTIVNNGSDADTLISGKTEAAQFIELHDMSMADGVMKMEPMANGAEIPAGETFSFNPQGAHIMLVNLNHNLERDSTYDLTLTFATSGDITVPVVVQFDAPDEGSSPVQVGDLTIEAIWSRPAPMITVGNGTHGQAMEHGATPPATPGN